MIKRIILIYLGIIILFVLYVHPKQEELEQNTIQVPVQVGVRLSAQKYVRAVFLKRKMAFLFDKWTFGGENVQHDRTLWLPANRVIRQRDSCVYLHLTDLGLDLVLQEVKKGSSVVFIDEDGVRGYK